MSSLNKRKKRKKKSHYYRKNKPDGLVVLEAYFQKESKAKLNLNPRVRNQTVPLILALKKLFLLLVLLMKKYSLLQPRFFLLNLKSRRVKIQKFLTHHTKIKINNKYLQVCFLSNHTSHHLNSITDMEEDMVVVVMQIILVVLVKYQIIIVMVITTTTTTCTIIIISIINNPRPWNSN